MGCVKFNFRFETGKVLLVSSFDDFNLQLFGLALGGHLSKHLYDYKNAPVDPLKVRVIDMPEINEPDEKDNIKAYISSELAFLRRPSSLKHVLDVIDSVPDLASKRKLVRKGKIMQLTAKDRIQLLLKLATLPNILIFSRIRKLLKKPFEISPELIVLAIPDRHTSNVDIWLSEAKKLVDQNIKVVVLVHESTVMSLTDTQKEDVQILQVGNYE
ncbi:MAG: hypothetical protein LBM13_03270 [Candidatus Ancillula sp.]|jgi:hypothetical protein|nr:hypothetical protein [Candidatus Ancillula sp.]